MAAVAERRFFHTFTARSHEGRDREEAAPPKLTAEKEAKLGGATAVADDVVDAAVVETANKQERRALSFSLSRRFMYIHAVRASGYVVLMESSPNDLTEKSTTFHRKSQIFPGKRSKEHSVK